MSDVVEGEGWVMRWREGEGEKEREGKGKERGRRTIEATKVPVDSVLERSIDEFPTRSALVSSRRKVLPKQGMVDMPYHIISSQHSVVVEGRESHAPPPLNFSAACNLILCFGLSVFAYASSALFNPFTYVW